MNTDYRNIRGLLDKYWQGESTLEEEKQMRYFFSQHKEKLSDDLEEIRTLFGFYEMESQSVVPELTFPFLQEPKKESNSPLKVFSILRHYWEYAAILLFLLGSVVLYQPGHQKRALATAEDTYQDPQEAFETTQKALELIATNLSKGKNGMAKLSWLNQAEQTIKGADRK